jgi:hypothetical protein
MSTPGAQLAIVFKQMRNKWRTAVGDRLGYESKVRLVESDV